MVDIVTLRKKYKKIIFWGAIKNVLIKYEDYYERNDYIIDSDINKWGSVIGKLTVFPPEEIKKESEKNSAIIILPLNREQEIYNYARSLGFAGDIYTDDMVLQDDFVGHFLDDIIVNGKYTIEKHTQILISLLKEYGVKNIIVSPGTCNMNFVYSVQSDHFFRLWSCIDERSAGYMACGMAQTIGEPVALSCTGATASRNYMSALTEAYYSKLPIVAITSSRDSFMIGNGIEQITDRRYLPKDVICASVEISPVHNLEEKKYCEININRALSMLKGHGGGPVHINLITRFEKDFTTKTLPKCRVIKTVTIDEQLPILKGKIGLYIRPSLELKDTKIIEMLDEFCEKYNAVIVGDHLCNYKGKYFINISLLADKSMDIKFDVLIYCGTLNRQIDIQCARSWRISTDGNIEDPFLNLEFSFDMSLESFLKCYNGITFKRLKTELFNYMEYEYENIIDKMPELPFSNLWIAQQMSQMIPNNSLCYFGIYSTLRNWSYFTMDKSIQCFSTVGGYGIDGTLSAMIGAALVNPSKLCFCFLGDLSFFYDMNVLGNKNIKSNVRILVLNNEGGNSLLYNNGLPEKDNYNEYVGAIGHFHADSKQNSSIKHYAESVGFEYLCATGKKDFKNNVGRFLELSKKPIIFEIKYDKENDFRALDILNNI